MSDTENGPAVDVAEQEAPQEKEHDPIEEAVIEKAKPKRPRTQKQIEAMAKAQKIRTENLKKMKELKEKADKEAERDKAKLDKEQQKALAQKIIEKYEAEKKRLKEEKQKARLSRAPPVVQPRPTVPRSEQPVARAVSTDEPHVVEFDFPTTQQEEDDYMGIFG